MRKFQIALLLAGLGLVAFNGFRQVKTAEAGAGIFPPPDRVQVAEAGAGIFPPK